MPRSTALVRTLRVLARLQSGHYSLLELAAEFQVDPRTIRRDIEALQEAHFPITSGSGFGGVIYWHAAP